MRVLLSIFGVLLLCLLRTSLYAQPVVLNDPDQTYLLFEHCAGLEVKPGQRITIDSLLKQPDRYAFIPLSQKPVQAGIGRTYWFKIELTNPSSDSYSLRFFYASDMLVRMYEVAKNRLINSGQVDYHGAATPDLFQRSRSILPLKLQSGQTHTLYFFVPNMGIPILHVGLMAPARLAKEVHYQDLLRAFSVGIALIIALYCLVLGIRLGDRDNLLYAIVIVTSMTIELSTDGSLLELSGNWPIMLRDNYGIHISLSVLLNLLFAFSFLQLKQQVRWLYRVGVGLGVIMALATLVVLGVQVSGQNDRLSQNVLAILVANLSSLFSVVAGIIVSVKGYRPGLFYALGQGMTMTCGIIFTLGLFGILPFTFWYQNALSLGGLGGTIFYQLGLIYKVNQLKKSHEEVLREQLHLTQQNQQLVETQNQVLEEKVEQRTAELRASQAQLIQKEKLASLGELTAGIAHEIQNPLNFVNNFSEVSTELIEEQKEALAKGDLEEAGFIADDLAQNLEKITLHGKRAGSIVRGMLEHSRASTGEKQPTDLNALAEEYLRLAYQGLRAKDNTFNCELVTDFAADLPGVSVVGQEIGRVLLNLYNNAFYAVHERAQQAEAAYQPTVWVSTRQEPGRVVVCVRDNGMGIPEAIREKIFQPFFTTKPTGEGTGLGLSLSYDIITKGHGGTMAVESREGEGTEFIIRLPL